MTIYKDNDVYILELHYIYFHTSDNIACSEEACKVVLSIGMLKTASEWERGVPLQVFSRAMALDTSLTVSKTQNSLLAAVDTFCKGYVKLSVLFISPE